MKRVSKILATVALLASGAASLGCFWWVADEPVAPKSLVD